MADWNSLKPIKTHLVVLKIVAVIFVSILIFTPKHAFRTNTSSDSLTQSNENLYTVVAVKGLTIRDKPNRNANPLISAPYQVKLKVIETDVVHDNINDKDGYWYKVEYQSTVGFAFGNYLKK